MARMLWRAVYVREALLCLGYGRAILHSLGIFTFFSEDWNVPFLLQYLLVLSHSMVLGLVQEQRDEEFHMRILCNMVYE